MKVSKILVGVKRDVRHAPYNVSQCKVELTGNLSPEDDLEQVYKELHSDAVIIVEEMVEVEKENYKQELNRV